MNNDNEIESKLAELMASFERRNAQTLQFYDQVFTSTPKTSDCPVCGHAAYLDETSLIGIYGEPRTPRYVCPPCQVKRDDQRRQQRLTRLGIPADVHKATLANFQLDRPNVKPGTDAPQKFLELCRRFQSCQIRNLILSGTVGIGKGHLAAALAIEAHDAGHSIAWHEISALYRAFHRAYESNDTEKIIAPLQSASLLVLDEIALRPQPADGEEILFSIIDARHKARRQTILLSNLPAPEIRSWLGERVTDRLRSGVLGFCFGQWDSMRGKEGF
jgi:DNA replication protein DnaC